MSPHAFIPNPYSLARPSASRANQTTSAQPAHTLSTATSTATATHVNTTPFPSLKALPSALPSLLTSHTHPSPPSAAAPSRTVIVWFRTDLRLHDHPALTHAIEEAGPNGHIIPVYIFDASAFGKTTFGFEKTGRHRARFLIQAVRQLRASLRTLRSDLIVRHGLPHTILPDLCQKLSATAVYAHNEIALDDCRDSDVATALADSGVDFCPLWANSLYEASDLPFALDDLPDVYGDFREAVLKSCRVREPLRSPGDMQSLPPAVGSRVPSGDVPTLRQLGLEGGFDHAHARKFVGGEEEALRKLNEYVGAVGPSDVSKPAGHIHLGTDFSCAISPWLSIGCISPRRIYNQLVRHGSRSARNSVYFELVWRDFFRFVTAKYNRAGRRQKAIAKSRVGRRRFSRTLVGAGL